MLQISSSSCCFESTCPLDSIRATRSLNSVGERVTALPSSLTTNSLTSTSIGPTLRVLPSGLCPLALRRIAATLRANSSMPNGLAMKSSAPKRNPVLRWGRSLLAVSNTNGVVSPLRRRLSSSWKPSSFGMLISETIRSTELERSRFIASRPSLAESVR